MTKWKDALDAELAAIQSAAKTKIDGAVAEYQKNGNRYQLEFAITDTHRAHDVARARVIAKNVVSTLSEDVVSQLFTLILNLHMIDGDGEKISGSQIFNRALHDRLVTKNLKRKP